MSEKVFTISKENGIMIFGRTFKTWQSKKKKNTFLYHYSMVEN